MRPKLVAPSLVTLFLPRRPGNLLTRREETALAGFQRYEAPSRPNNIHLTIASVRLCLRLRGS